MKEILVEEDGKASANKEEALSRKKDGDCGGQRGRRFGQGEEGDESCRFGSVVVSSLAAGEREYENGRLGSAGAVGVLLV